MRKRKTIVVSVAILMVLCVMSSGCTSGGNKIAVVPLNGPIQSGEAGLLFGGSVITPQLVRSQLERARQDDTVKAVVLQVESPGGVVAACQEIVNEIERVDKPIVVSMGSIAASGGYFISAKADKIVALPATLTGSIGVISQVPNLRSLG